MDQLVAGLKFSNDKDRRPSGSQLLLEDGHTPHAYETMWEVTISHYITVMRWPNAGAQMDPRMLVSHNLSSYQPATWEVRGQYVLAERRCYAGRNEHTVNTCFPRLGHLSANDATLYGAKPHV